MSGKEAMVLVVRCGDKTGIGNLAFVQLSERRLRVGSAIERPLHNAPPGVK